MPWNGSGTFSRQYGSSGWENDKNAGTKIVASRHDTNDDDLATGVNNCLAKDGQNTAMANLPMGGYRHTNVGLGVATTDYATVRQVQLRQFQWLTGMGGTGDAITGGTTPALTSSYTIGQVVRFFPTAVNTGAVTLNVNSVGAVAVTKCGGIALNAGDIQSGTVVSCIYNGTSWDLLDEPVHWGYLAGVAGTNTITATGPVNDLAAGQMFIFVPANTNTGAVTIDIGPGAKDIKRPDLTALKGGELVATQEAVIVYDGTQFQLMTAPTIALQSTTTASTGSPTSIPYTGIPASARRINILLSGVSLNGSANLRIRIGPSGGVETSGYSSINGRIATGNVCDVNVGTAGFDIQIGGNTRAIHGRFVLDLLDSATNTWAASWGMGVTTANISNQGGGSKALAGVLTQIAITTDNGTDTFDAGIVNVSWE